MRTLSDISFFKVTLGFLASIVFLVGCTTQTKFRAPLNTTNEQYLTDWHGCDRDATYMTFSRYPDRPPPPVEAGGWVGLEDLGRNLQRVGYEDNIFETCMRGKNYKVVKDDCALRAGFRSLCD